MLCRASKCCGIVLVLLAAPVALGYEQRDANKGVGRNLGLKEGLFNVVIL